MNHRATETLLKHMQVPDWNLYYILGSFERRVTLYSQQVRALNLIWSLFEEQRLAKGGTIAIVGGGAAGLTAAAAATYLGADVTVLERNSTLLPIQRHCRHRWLHPHIYDWPAEGSLQSNAGLPLMNWHADYADPVARQLEKAWKKQAGTANVVLNVRSIDPTKNGLLAWNAEGSPRKQPFNVVVLAVGFGLEEAKDALEVRSYWSHDDLDRFTPEPTRHLVSGCGDGGLVDLLRIRVLDFQHDKFVEQFVHCADTTALSQELHNIEEEAKRRDGRGESSAEYLWQAYQDLDVPPEIDTSFKLRPDTTATLCTRDGQPYTLGASILNRFLVSRLLKLPNGKVELRQGELSKDAAQKKDGRFVVQFANGQPEPFDCLTVRHGPTSALEKHFPAIWKASAATLRARNVFDSTRDQLWPDHAFGPEPSAEEEVRSPPSARSSRSFASATHASDPSLADYLTRLQKEAGSVTLAGDTEPRRLEGVFVDLEITRSGAIATRHPQGEVVEDGTIPPQDSHWEDVKTELAQRRDELWSQRSNTETIPADSLLDLAHRTLIVGAAGTGKSTLVRCLACRAAEARINDIEARIPVWLPRVPSYRDLEENLSEELAKRALKAVGLDDGPSEGRNALASAISNGRAVVLIDSLDEAGADEQAQFAPWLSKLEGRVILASRPQLAESAWHDVVQVTLHGIPAIAAEQMLQRYFPGAPWVVRLIEALRGLADGRLWLETPVLLGLAATLYRANEALPTSTLDLYREAIDLLLQSKRLPESHRGDFFRSTLRTFAKKRLSPEAGSPHVIFSVDDLPMEHRSILLQTGLFEGTSRLRFTHLSLGERLAAEADIDLARARNNLAEAKAEDVKGSALEVLPMAHAIHAPVALEGALVDARAIDRSDHRLLRLLLRSIGYGGDGVAQFCRTQGSAVVRLVAERLQTSSGRFSDAERKLMDAAERAFLVVRRLGPVSNEEVEQVLAPLLRARGGAAAEAHVATWILGVRPLGRAPVRWWTTIRRQAYAIVRERPDIDAVRNLTRGRDDWDRSHAIQILGKYPEHWPVLRPFLDDNFDRIRIAAIFALKDDPNAQVALRERLTDDDASIRARIVTLFGSPPERRAKHIDRLHSTLAHDPSMDVRAAAINVLADDPQALPFIRRAFEETNAVPETVSGDFVELRVATLQALANDGSSEDRIRGLLEQPKWFWLWPERLLQNLARWPAWRECLLRRLRAPDVAAVEVRAMARDPDARPAIVALLDHRIADVVSAAIGALKVPGPDDQKKLIALLHHEAIGVRCAAMNALGDFNEHWPALHPFLESKEPRERFAALEAVRQDPAAQDRAFACLYEDPAHEVRQAAVGVLGSRATGRDVLRHYFTATQSKPAHEHFTSADTFIAHCYLRALIVRTLAIDPSELDHALLRSALKDRHAAVREIALQVVPLEPSLHETFCALLDDEDTSVRHAAYAEMAEDRGVRAKLIEHLHEDQWPVRISAFRALVDHAEARSKLQALLSSTTTPSSERASIIEPLLRDPDSRPQIRACIDDKDSQVRDTTLGLLRHDAEVRRTLRERARKVGWLREASFDFSDRIFDILASDPEAHPILRTHLALDDADVLKAVAPTLADDKLAYPRLRALLDHPDDGVKHVALRALGKDEVALPRILAALSSSDKYIRENAAKGLRDLPEARAHFLSLLRDPEKSIRQIALQVLKAERKPAVKQALRDRLTEEPDERLRFHVVKALADDAEAIGLLRDRLHHDPDSAVRIAAAEALSTKATYPAVALETLPSITRILALLPATAATTNESALLARLRTFVEEPVQIDIDADPDLGELAIAWACVRLTWASEDGSLSTGRVFGEVEKDVERISKPGQALVVRVAMDVSELPRERFLSANHNLIEAWRVVQHLRASNPPSVFLACANVDFEHLVPPPLAPGEVLFGPVFFGFRLPDTIRGGK